jgi:hypothetical protein
LDLRGGSLLGAAFFYWTISPVAKELIGHGTKVKSKPRPFKPERVGHPEKLNQSRSVNILRWYHPTASLRQQINAKGWPTRRVSSMDECLCAIVRPVVRILGGTAMKRSKLFPTLMLLFGACCFGQGSSIQITRKSSNADPGYSITVSSPSEPIRLGSPINVAIDVTVGNKEIYWRAEKGDTAYRAFHFSVTKDGRVAETTVFHRRITGKPRRDDPPPEGFGTSSILSSVAPGKTFTLTIDLTKIYEITEPGVYTLDVSRTEEDNKTIVRAKPLTLNIVP